MFIVLRSTYSKVKNNVFSCGHITQSSPLVTVFLRNFSDEKSNNPEFINSTILVECGFNVQELPVIVRKLKDVTEFDEKPPEPLPQSQDSLKYHLIQAEFQQCSNLRDVFSLLSKCTKITPNIALGAMERINTLEKEPIQTPVKLDPNLIHAGLARGAILDKLLKVVLKTEDTQTILNVLNAVSNFMEPYKHKFCDELLFRAIDNKLSIDHLCQFISFLVKNKTDEKYSDTIDKLWVGFVEREGDIDENNIVNIFSLLSGLKVSKRTIITLLEQKMSVLWSKISVLGMQEILRVLIDEKYFTMESYSLIGRWFNTNIHALNEDALLDIITKFTRLSYSDDQIEKAVEKYMKLRGPKIESQILMVGILNYCIQFHNRNENVLNACAEYFVHKGTTVPLSFLKSFVYPFGFLCFDPHKSSEFWSLAEEIVLDKFSKLNIDDICYIILSFIYNSKYPLELAHKVFNSENIVKFSNTDTSSKLHLIDTALSLECDGYPGPLMPKNQWSKSCSQDVRIKKIIEKTWESFVAAAGGEKNMSTGVIIPNIHADETYVIDVMLHPAGLGGNTFNWKNKTAKNESIAILIHLPDHYCSDNKHLIGPQMMRRKHLRLLGLKVVSLKYSLLSQFYTTRNTIDMKKYVLDCVKQAEPCVEK